MPFSPLSCYTPFVRYKHIPFLKLPHIYISYSLQTLLYTHLKKYISFSTLGLVRERYGWPVA